MIGTITQLKWLLFRTLELLSEMRRGGPGAGRKSAPKSWAFAVGSQPALGSRPFWVFVSTIGELNAIEPFLKRLLAERDAPPLILLTDHPHYRESFLAKYPHARVCGLDHRSETAAALVEAWTPRLLLLAEIPCLLSDAPCRFPFALVYELKRRGVPICMVNGWLYRQAPPCTMDAIEKQLFGRDYLRLIDLMTVQDDATRDSIIAQGADPNRVFVAGNMKFDAIAPTEWDPGHARSPVVLKSIVASHRPTVVAGCVTNISEQVAALDGFVTVLRQLPHALLVLAPRHPEVPERMQQLRTMLAERNLTYAFKSEIDDVSLPDDLDCLVLDTMGELKDFYAAGSIAYVGLNHNVLEPMAFGKPVVVTPGWEPVYPSFPVYQRLLARGAITQVETDKLGEAWLDLLRDPVSRSAKHEEIGRILESLKGATTRSTDLLTQFGLLHGTN